MSDAKYPSLTVTLETRIMEGFYPDKVPTTRALAAEFGVSRQTVTNALRPLIDKGVLVSDGRRGVIVCRKYQGQGMIGIVATGDLSRLHADEGLQKLQNRINSDGFESVLISISPWISHRNICNLLGQNFAGLIFTNSSLTLEIAEYLEKRKIPFISCNRLPVYSRLNFVEHDWASAIKDIAADFAAKGYRRQNLFFHGRLEGYDRLIRKEWRNIKSDLKLPELSGDNIELDFTDSSVESFAKYLKKLNELQDYPELLIMWHVINEKTIEMVTTGPWRLPETCHVVGVENRNMALPPGFTVFKEGSNYYDLMFAAYEGLRELISAPSDKLIHRMVKYTISMEPH